MTINEFLSSWWGITIIVIGSIAIWLLLSIVFYRGFFKRFYDIVFSILLFIPYVFVYILVAPIIYFTDKGPVYYKGERLGKDGKVFKMHKFRSMRMNAPDIRNTDGTTYNSENDPRVTKIGRIIRKTSIDELPQLIDVFMGKMSFVGPRPDLPDSISLYDEKTKEKLKVRPGITGYSQAVYRNTSTLEQRFSGDVYYANNVSLLLDLKIIFMTIVGVLTHKNIYRNDSEDKK